MQRFNVFGAECTYAQDRPAGYKCGSARFGPLVGAAQMSGSVYEIPTGESTFPYHYEYGSEEWLLVLQGNPTLRHPDGEDELEEGDLVCFRNGPEGAHKVTNHGHAPARVIILSTFQRPAIAVFPDSHKLGVWSGGESDNLIAEHASAVPYWHGEA
jgi:uncharacterized cupin superfamily protein